MFMPDPPHARMQYKGFIQQWKPIGVWLKGKWSFDKKYYLGFRKDTFINSPKQRNEHPEKWEQNLDWAMYCVENYSKPGEIVLDPMMGTGTMGIACRKLGREFIGIELEPDVFDIAKKRLSEQI